MAIEPATGSSLTVTFAFLFLIVQPAIACEGWGILKQNFSFTETGNGLIVVSDDTHLDLTPGCSMDMTGEVKLQEMIGPIKVKVVSLKVNGMVVQKDKEIEDVCDSWNRLEEGKKEKFHDFIDCFISFIKVDTDCHVPEQTIHHSSCNIEHYKKSLRAGTIETEMEIYTGDGNKVALNTLMVIGKQK